MAMKRSKPHPAYVVPGKSVEVLNRLPDKHDLFDEKFLQELIANHSELLPVQDLRADVGSLLCVGRELSVGEAGKLDNLYLSTSGYPVLVEVKLRQNSESRRKVLVQALDYMKEIVADVPAYPPPCSMNRSFL